MPDIEIFMAEGKPMVSSRLIADHFGKDHKHVLRDIKNLMANLPESFNGSNFGPVEYQDAKGEKRPANKGTVAEECLDDLPSLALVHELLQSGEHPRVIRDAFDKLVDEVAQDLDLYESKWREKNQ